MQDRGMLISDLTEDRWQSIYLTNMRNLNHYTAWAKNEDQIREILNEDKAVSTTVDPRQYSKLSRQFNSEITRISMHVLCKDTLRTHGKEIRAYSIRELAIKIDKQRERAIQTTLSNATLPILLLLGFIEGFRSREKWSTRPHRISVTQKGIAAHCEYLQRSAEI